MKQRHWLLKEPAFLFAEMEDNVIVTRAMRNSNLTSSSAYKMVKLFNETNLISTDMDSYRFKIGLTQRGITVKKK